ncbi:MAG: SEC-C domain-containing protein [Bacteroidetes bacterium]|nr:SEC-C domain-containing protein [Bacteroidota bacterium]
MNVKMNRNDPCFCGSGKKFKKCCISEGRIIVADKGWQKLRETEGKLVDGILLPYVASVAEDLLAFAWEDFWLEHENFPQGWYDGVAQQLISAWMLFDWKPDALESLGDIEIEEGFPIALQFLQKKGHLLTNYEKEFIRKICQTYYSFYVVLNVVPNESITLKDILLKNIVTVKELQGSNILQPGDVVFNRVLTMESQSICVGMFPMRFPSQLHADLLEIREKLIAQEGELTPEKLTGELADPIRLLFFNMCEELLNPILPEVSNSDGDPLIFCTLQFSLGCSVEEASQALLPMTLSKDINEFLVGAKQDKKTGQIKCIELPWIKRGKNTIWGDIKIESNKLTIKVNSLNRANKAEKEIAKRLGEKAQFIKMKQSTLKQEMKRQEKKSKKPLDAEIPEAEVKKIIEKQLKEHYINWLDEALPILKGLTPREAAKSNLELDRERLDALLLDFERKNLNPNHPQVNVAWLKKELDLI